MTTPRILGGSNYQALQVCGKGFEATDGTVHDCTSVAGHEGPHAYKNWTEGRTSE